MGEDKHSLPGDFHVIRCDLPAFVGDYTQLDYGDPFAERTVQMRDEFHLTDVVNGYDTEFAAQRALKRWVRSRWDHGWSLRFSEMQDALDILRAAASGEHFNCGFYTRVFIECARALGWAARPLGIGVRDVSFPRGHNVGNVGHSVPEIWSNEFRKWVILDPDLNVHYERNGVPLSALELHDAWLSHEGDTVTMVQEQPAFTPPTGDHVGLVCKLMDGMEHFDERQAALMCRRFVRHNVLDYYARLSLGKWTWLDARCLPEFVVHFAPGATNILTSNPDDLYWSLNQVRLAAAPSWAEEPKLTLRFEHCMPWFDRHEIRVEGGDWQASGDSFQWPLREGANTLEVRPVNVCQRPGLTSRLEVAYAPANW